MQAEIRERLERRWWRLRRNQNWLRIKALFLPNVVILSHHRSGYQWFRQICDANLYRHVVMPPGARYQHYNVERMPAKNKLHRNGILLVRDGRDVMISMYMSVTRDGPDGMRVWRHNEEPVTLSQYLRSDAGALRDATRRVLALMTPVELWAKFNTDWLGNPNILSVVRYEDLLRDQAAEIVRVKQSFGYADQRQPVQINLDFDRHGPTGTNLPAGYQRRGEGNWRRLFTPEDIDFFSSHAGATMRALGYEPPGEVTAQ